LLEELGMLKVSEKKGVKRILGGAFAILLSHGQLSGIPATAVASAFDEKWFHLTRTSKYSN
jgi:hypothetical protein